MISAATTLISGMIGESSDEGGLGRAGVPIYFDFQVLQVELLASDQLDVEHTTFATAKNRRIDISAPTIAAALSNDRSVDELHLRAFGPAFTRQQVIDERQIFVHDLMEPAHDHPDFADPLRGRMQTGKLAQHGFDNPLADRQFVYPAKLMTGRNR